ERLAAVAPGDLAHVFFSESGSVSVEIAMKIAIQYWLNRGRRRTRFLSFAHAYHGDTFAAMSVCDPDEGMHAHFAGALAEQLVVPLPVGRNALADFDRTLARHAGDLAAVLLEPLVQAAGGMKFHNAETLAGVAEAARRHGVLLILDEIVVGFGRTGTLRPDRQAVRVRAGRGRAGPDGAVEVADRGHAAARRDAREAACLRRVLVRRRGARSDARADVHRQSARLCGRACVSRSLRARAEARAGRANRGGARGGAGALPQCERRARRAGQGRDRRRAARAGARCGGARRAAQAVRRRGRLGAAVRRRRLSDAAVRDHGRRARGA